VPLRFVGKAAGVVRGGILQPIVREIEVECLPLDIPEFFNVDVSELDIGDSVHVEELTMPEGVTALFDSNFALVTVVTPTVEEAPAAPAAAVVEGAPAAPVAPEATKEGETRSAG
jgi:large subunit ribosomal protein L25